MVFYKRYKELCESEGKALSVVAKECGLSEKAPSTWKGNDKKAPVIPSIHVAAVIAEHFNVSTDYLILEEPIDKSVPSDESELLNHYRSLPDNYKAKCLNIFKAICSELSD